MTEENNLNDPPPRAHFSSEGARQSVADVTEPSSGNDELFRVRLACLHLFLSYFPVFPH